MIIIIIIIITVFSFIALLNQNKVDPWRVDPCEWETKSILLHGNSKNVRMTKTMTETDKTRYEKMLKSTVAKKYRSPKA